MKFYTKLGKDGKILLPKELIEKLFLVRSKSNLTLTVTILPPSPDGDYSSASNWYICITSTDAEVADEL